MTVFVDSASRSTERAFKCKAVDQIELSPHDNPGSRFSSFLNYEVAVLEAEMLSVLAKYVREQTFLQAISLLVRATIHEDVLLPGVAVEVAKEEDISRLKSFSHHELHSEVFRVHLRRWSNPLPIEILPS